MSLKYIILVARKLLLTNPDLVKDENKLQYLVEEKLSEIYNI